MLYIVASSHLVKWLSTINEYSIDLGNNLIHISADGNRENKANPVDQIVYYHGNKYNRVIHKVGNIKHINVYVDYMFAPGQILIIENDNYIDDMLDINNLSDARQYLNNIILKLHPEYSSSKNDELSDEDKILLKEKQLNKLITLPTNNLSLEERIRSARNM